MLSLERRSISNVRLLILNEMKMMAEEIIMINVIKEEAIPHTSIERKITLSSNKEVI